MTDPTRQELVAEFRKEYGHRTQFLQTAVLSAFSQSADFAKEVIKALIILHGGILAALPPLLQLLGIRFAQHETEFQTITISAGLGLICSVAAAICGYFALRHLGLQFSAAWDAAQHSGWESVYTDFGMATEAHLSRETAFAMQDSKRKHEKTAGLWEFGGVFFALVSLAAFVIIGWTAGRLIMLL